MDQGMARAEGRSMIRDVVRWLPVLVVVAIVVACLVLGVRTDTAFQVLAKNRESLLAFVAGLGLLAPLVFIAVYVAVAALSIPLGAILTVTAGFLFGTVAGGLYSLLGATAGGTILFLVARTSFGSSLQRRAGPMLQKMEAGFQENAANYLFVLRIVPLFPFWLVNLVSAFFGIPLRTFVLVSLLGMAPASFVYAYLGAGIGAVIEAGRAPDFDIIKSWPVLGPLLALALLALIPVVYKRLKQRQEQPAR
jgi:uncharacterized membrane protein YdjX (TVP38/TMEM64 family)